MSFRQKKTTPNTCPATPNATLSGATHGRGTSASLLQKTRKSKFGAPNKKKVKAMFYMIAGVPLSPVGIAVSQDHQRSSTLASDVTETINSSTLYSAATPSPLKVKSKVLPDLSSSSTQKPWLIIFSQNVAPPALSATFPSPGAQFENTAQLAYYGNLLRKCLSPSSATTCTPYEPLHQAQHALIESYAQSENNGSRIRSLIQRVVEEFAADNLKTIAVLSEVLLLAPSLDQEHYRKLLNCVITEFENARLQDLAMLQGIVQLVECASSDYLESDDLVRILVVLRTRLQDTHKQSTKHLYYLTWVLSRLLDVMVEGKVKDLRRVVDQEPLSALFNQLKNSNDPFIKHQVIYAYQGLLHIPNDETRRQCMLRYTGNITMGLLGVASVCKLDLGQLKVEADRLYEAAGVAHQGGTDIADGARSLFESGPGIWASVKGDIFSGGRQLWYTSLREAQQYIRNGRLQDFNNLVFEAPCRTHIDFQWGVCRLLGDIAVDPLWETSTRHLAVDFLAELYRNDSIWTPGESIYCWILGILRMIAALEDTAAISDHALLILQGLEKAGDAAKQELFRYTMAGPLCSYPIQVRLSIPASSTLLSRVLAIPAVEYDVLRLKDLRLEQQENALYIQPQAKPSLQSPDDTLFPLMEKVLEFLSSPGLVFLLLGDSGGGKSTFNLQLERILWKSYKRGEPIPLHINLPSIDNPLQNIIVKQLQELDFTDTQIMELKQNRQFIVICDGYDESQLTSNIHTSNHFNRPGQWKVKMIVTCRTQYLGSDYRNWFVPQGSSAYDRSTPDLFQEAVIAPFTKEQVQRYVDIYVPLESRTWGTKDYMDRLTTIPNLMDLVKNPFLLSLALEAMPGVTDGGRDLATIKVTRVQLYDTFVQHWLEVNQRRLQKTNALSSEDQSMLVQLVDAGFISLGIDYSTKLALAIFDKQDGNPVVQYVHFNDKNTWKAAFFGSQADVRLLRDSSPLTRAGNHFRFVHRSMLEYFFSRVIYNPAKNDEEFDSQAETVPTVSQPLDANAPLFQRDLLQEPSVINFLCDRVKLNSGFNHQLRAIIERSKTDANAAIAATNAITILVRAGVSFNSADLRGIKIPGADLSNGQFDSAQFQGADLRGVNLSKGWLRQADMSDAYMEGARFGELPYLEVDFSPYSCTYSPDGKLLGVALYNGIICIYETSTWTRMHRLEGHAKAVRSIAFSPDSQRLLSGGDDKTARLWDANNGEVILVMEGHRSLVYSATTSPCGNRIASASIDKTVRLWDALTGERLFVLKGYEDRAMSFKYSPDGHQLTSCSRDGTIQFWDPRIEEPGIVSSPSSGAVESLAYSPDGRWAAAGPDENHLQDWNTVSLEPGPVLSGHTRNVTGIDFSPDGRWIVSSSEDQTVRLWDASTSALVTVLTGHNNYVSCVAFSPDSRQIASGGHDKKVRLWEVGSSWSSLDPRDGGCEEWLAYSRDGLSILSYHLGGIFRLWDAATGTSAPIPHKMPEQKAITSRAYALDGSQLAFGYEDGSIRLWNCKTGMAGPVLNGHSNRIRILVYSPFCRWIVSVDFSNTVRLWDLHDFELRPLLVEVDKSLDRNVGAVAFSSAGGQFAISNYGDTIYLIDAQSRERLGRAKLEGDISSLVYSPNDQQIAIGTMAGGIYFWDLQSKESSAALEGHKSWVRCIAYSPCGQWIASASDDMTVGIWNRRLSGEVESWSRVHSICAFFGQVGNVAWNPVVPRELVTGASDGSVQVWRMSIDEGWKVVFKMVWGSNLSTLCTDGATFTNTLGLSLIYQKLLLQRGALPPSEEPTFLYD